MLSKSQVKYIQSLAQKKFRDSEGLFIAEGPKIVGELLGEIPQNVITIYALAQWLRENENCPNVQEIITIKESELKQISQLSTPNQIVAVCKKPHFESIVATQNITLALDTIQDPGNLGTIIRIADWFGIKQIVASNESADMYACKVIQASMGSIARIHVFYTHLEEWLQKQSAKIYATTLDGRDINTLNKLEEAIIVMGNESKGISSEIIRLAHERITISKIGRAESLNAAVATGIILSKIVS